MSNNNTQKKDAEATSVKAVYMNNCTIYHIELDYTISNFWKVYIKTKKGVTVDSFAIVDDNTGKIKISKLTITPKVSDKSPYRIKTNDKQLTIIFDFEDKDAVAFYEPVDCNIKL